MSQQLYDIRMMNKLKRNFISCIKDEYEEIILGILNTSMKYSYDIKGNTSTCK